jgi:hypothetical protein
MTEREFVEFLGFVEFIGFAGFTEMTRLLRPDKSGLERRKEGLSPRTMAMSLVRTRLSQDIRRSSRLSRR